MNTTPTQKVEVPGGHSNTDKIQSDVVDTLLVGLTWMIFPALLLDFYRASDIGWQPLNTGHLISATFVCFLAVARKRIRLQLRQSDSAVASVLRRSCATRHRSGGSVFFGPHRKFVQTAAGNLIEVSS